MIRSHVCSDLHALKKNAAKLPFISGIASFTYTAVEVALLVHAEPGEANPPIAETTST